MEIQGFVSETENKNEEEFSFKHAVISTRISIYIYVIFDHILFYFREKKATVTKGKGQRKRMKI